MTVVKKKIFQKSWFHGGGGGLVAGACCLLHALAVAVGFGAGAALFGQWMEEYRSYFFLAGMFFMAVTFVWSIKKHKISARKALAHAAIMVSTFLVVFGLLNVFLVLTS